MTIGFALGEIIVNCPLSIVNYILEVLFVFLAKSNQDKREQTPYEWMSHDGAPSWDAFERRVQENQKLSRRKKNFLLDLSPYDVIIGYRADDSYFSFARAFLGNAISLQQLSHAMRLGKLGEQIVLKSPAAFDAIRFISCIGVDHTEYYVKRKARDEEARAAYQAELENDDLNGLYMRDILREELTPDDPRLR